MSKHFTGKICVVCREDCAGRPRTKDRKGRYYCQGCYEAAIKKARAKRAASAALDRADEHVAEERDLVSLMLEQGATPSDQTTPCPGCGQLMPGDAVICTSCGFNTQSGQKLSVTMAKPKRDWSAGVGVLLSPGLIALAILGVFGILFYLGLREPIAATSLILLTMFLSLAAWVLVLVFAFRESILQGILTLVVPLYIFWFVYGVNDNRYVKWTFSCSFTGQALAVWLIVLISFEPSELQMFGQ